MTAERVWTRAELGQARDAFNDHVNGCETCTSTVVDGDDDYCPSGDELDQVVMHANANLQDHA